MDWGYWTSQVPGLNVTSLQENTGIPLAVPDLGNWSTYSYIGDHVSCHLGGLFNATAYDYGFGDYSSYTNYTANQTEWATFVAECYGVAAGKAGLVAAGSSAACALLPLTCLPIGAYSMYVNAKTAAAVMELGVDGLDPCAGIRNAYPVEAAYLVSQPAALAGPAAGAAPLASLLTTAGLLLVLLASIFVRRRQRTTVQAQTLV